MYRFIGRGRGEQVLVGPEAILIRRLLEKAVQQVLDFYHAEPEDFEVQAFDALTPQQQLHMLNLIGRAMLLETEPFPGFTAPGEATIAVLFERLREEITYEIDETQYTEWRDMLLACFDPGDSDEPLPANTSPDHDEWAALIVALQGQFLIDQDFEDDEVADLDPVVGAALKQNMGIPPDYFAWCPPDPTESEVVAIVESLGEMAGRKFHLPCRRPSA